jgi:Flp pilus assembly protein TadD
MGRVFWCTGFVVGGFVACAPASTPPPAAPSATPSMTANGGPSTAGTVPSPPSAALPPTSPPPDWSALRASEADCEGCHPDEVGAWRDAPMGRSLHAYVTAPGAAPRRPVERPRAAVLHPKTARRFTVALDARGVPTFGEPTAPGAKARTASYLIGSGTHTRSYLWAEGDALFEAPLTWYPKRGLWDLSPGYDVVEHPGMYREIRPDCLFCHADPSPHVEGSLNRYQPPMPAPIGCTRCHGDARPHVRARLAGDSSDDPVMPSRLDAARRADVCNQCHYAGAVRLAREGHRFGEYLPPGRLADSVAVFRRIGTKTDGFGIASHAERLSASRCGGGKLGCTDCHAPHAVHVPGTARPDRSQACRACHGERHRRCAGPSGPDCVRCHMRTAPTNDIPHVAMTDHLIRARLDDGPPRVPSSAPPSRLVWIATEDAEHAADPEADLLLARAYAEAARRGGPHAEADRDAALARLPRALADFPTSAEGLADLASMYRLAGDRVAAEAAIERAYALLPGDVRIARAAATARTARGDGPGALEAVTSGLARDPQSAALHIAGASAALLLGRRDDAARALARAATLRPGDAEVLMAQAVHAELSARWDDASAAFRDAARAAPENVLAHMGVYRHAVRRADWPGAKTALAAAERSLVGRGAVPEGLRQRLDAASALVDAGLGRDAESAPRAVALLQRGLREPDAAHALGLISMRAGQPEAAVRFLAQAVGWMPEDGAAWASLASVLERAGKPDLAERAGRQARRFGAHPHGSR